MVFDNVRFVNGIGIEVWSFAALTIKQVSETFGAGKIARSVCPLVNSKVPFVVAHIALLV